MIDTVTGERRTLLADLGRDFTDPHISPDGAKVVAAARTHDSYEKAGDATLVVVPMAGGDATDLLPGLDRRPSEAAWAPDSQAVYFTADDHGRCPVFRADLAGSAVTRITTDDGAYSNLCPSPDGRFMYALRAAVDSPPGPVRIDLTLPGSASQPRMTAPSSAAASTSVSRPGSSIWPPGLGRACGGLPGRVRSIRTGPGGLSTAARSAYRNRPSGDGHRFE